MTEIDRLFQKYYFSQPAFVDGTTEFHQKLERILKKGWLVLEIGAGPQNRTSAKIVSLGARLVGVDIDFDVRTNPDLALAVQYDGARLPFQDHVFDACVSDYVLEHIADPATHFAEVSRVLKKGGSYCFRTPNLYHFLPLFSKAVPHTVHLRLANQLRGREEGAHDPYPTHYRANTRSVLLRLARASQLDVPEFYLLEKEPSYARTSKALFFAMMTYERIVNRFRALANLRINIICRMQKP
jgi:SAM-dependent methyltransferase